MNDESIHQAEDVIYGMTRAAEMRKAPGLALVREKVAQSSCPLLDRAVWKRTDLGFAPEVLAIGPSRRLYLDIPVRAIVALTHRNFSKSMEWRGMLQDLHGFGWTEEVIKYFESEIGKSWFPAPNAAGELRFDATGGAVTCTNGVHRLVAAACWLGATQGAGATLRKVSVRYRPRNVAIVTLLRKLQQEGCTLSIGDVDSHSHGRIYFARATAGGRMAYYLLGPDGCSKIKAGSRLVARIRGWAGLTANAVHHVESWRPIPGTILDMMAEDDWILRQAVTPKYTEHPK
jgi:hypothetical protein